MTRILHCMILEVKYVSLLPNLSWSFPIAFKPYSSTRMNGSNLLHDIVVLSSFALVLTSTHWSRYFCWHFSFIATSLYLLKFAEPLFYAFHLSLLHWGWWLIAFFYTFYQLLAWLLSECNLRLWPQLMNLPSLLIMKMGLVALLQVRLLIVCIIDLEKQYEWSVVQLLGDLEDNGVIIMNVSIDKIHLINVTKYIYFPLSQTDVPDQAMTLYII